MGLLLFPCRTIDDHSWDAQGRTEAGAGGVAAPQQAVVLCRACHVGTGQAFHVKPGSD